VVAEADLSSDQLALERRIANEIGAGMLVIHVTNHGTVLCLGVLVLLLLNHPRRRHQKWVRVVVVLE